MVGWVPPRSMSLFGIPFSARNLPSPIRFRRAECRAVGAAGNRHFIGCLKTRKNVSQMRRIAILSTSFGFGPVSKAITIGRTFRQRHADVEICFFGSGIAMDFAVRSGSIDRIINVDVDRIEALSELLPTLREYSAVISVLNLDILPLWRKGIDPPLFLVDSLAWMWNQPPVGLGNVEAYFIQDYLLDGVRTEMTGEVPIPPIDATWDLPKQAPKTHLLVNLSGCHNPLVNGQLYHRYAEVLVKGVVEVSRRRFPEVIICCNAQLAIWIRSWLGDLSGFRIAHLPHDEFLRLMAQAACFVTSPGITTTVEAISLRVFPRFLLPQNYSQALIAQKYDDHSPSIPGMPLHRFGERYRIPLGLPESVGVARVIDSVDSILKKPKAVVTALEQVMGAPEAN